MANMKARATWMMALVNKMLETRNLSCKSVCKRVDKQYNPLIDHLPRSATWGPHPTSSYSSSSPSSSRPRTPWEAKDGKSHPSTNGKSQQPASFKINQIVFEFIQKSFGLHTVFAKYPTFGVMHFRHMPSPRYVDHTLGCVWERPFPTLIWWPGFEPGTTKSAIQTITWSAIQYRSKNLETLSAQ